LKKVVEFVSRKTVASLCIGLLCLAG